MNRPIDQVLTVCRLAIASLDDRHQQRMVIAMLGSEYMTEGGIGGHPPEVAGMIDRQTRRGALTEAEIEALPVGATVHRVDNPDVVYTRTTGGPNGPWRRYEQGVGPVTCTSTTLAMIGVVDLLEGAG